MMLFRNIYISFLSLIVIMLSMSSCETDKFEDTDKDHLYENNEVSFDVIEDGNGTRAITWWNSTFFEPGDAIGIFAVKRSDNSVVAYPASSGNYGNNLKWIRQIDGSWIPASGSDKLYYPNDGAGLDIYAYFPYDPNATDPTNIVFTINSSQSDWDGFMKTLFLSARNTNGTKLSKTNTPISLKFYNKLALVETKVSTDNTSKAYGFSKDIAVTLTVKTSSVLLNLSSKTIENEATSMGDETTVNMFRALLESDPDYETEYIYRALVPAQKLSVGSRLFNFYVNGKLSTYKVQNEVLNLTTGNIKKFDIYLPRVISTQFINKGSFWMGSPSNEPGRKTDEAQRFIKLTKSFRMGTYEVTNRQFADFLNDLKVPSTGIYNIPSEGSKRLVTNHPLGVSYANGIWMPSNDAYNDNPVVFITWDGANLFAQWAGGRLPTEAEWEYACRATTNSNEESNPNTMPFGIFNGQILTYRFANFAWKASYVYPNAIVTDTSAPTVLNRPTTVGSYAKNAWGLYDMHGNVLEMCSDFYGPYDVNDLIDPKGTPSGIMKVAKGGSWNVRGMDCRSAIRAQLALSGYGTTFGFRVVFD